MSEVRVGDRVRIRADAAEGFVQPYRKFGQQGRGATVTSVGALTARVDFDTRRKGARAHHMHPRLTNIWRDFEPLPPPA